MKNVFHHETVGIPDLVVKLFIGVQQYAIESGSEVISLDLIQDVAKALFEPAQDALAAQLTDMARRCGREGEQSYRRDESPTYYRHRYRRSQTFGS